MKTTIALLVGLTALPVVAQSHLEFDDISLFGGTLTYNGADGVGPLIGTDIIFDTVIGVGTPVTGPLQIVGGLLNFTTGPNVSETPTIYQFAGGGSFKLTGTVIKPDLSVVATGDLLNGYFVGDSVVLGLGGGNGLFSGVGLDEKNRDLLAYYGIPFSALFQFANTEIGFAVLGLDPAGGFVADVRDSDLTNSVVPEPKQWAAIVAIGALSCWKFYRRLHERR